MFGMSARWSVRLVNFTTSETSDLDLQMEFRGLSVQTGADQMLSSSNLYAGLEGEDGLQHYKSLNLLLIILKCNFKQLSLGYKL